MMKIGDRIKIAAEKVGGLDRLAELIPVVSRRSLSDYVSNKSEPRASVIALIAQQTSASAEWLINGEGQMFRTALDMIAHAERRAEAEQLLETNSKKDYFSNFIHLPMYDGVSASAGPGTMPTGEHANGVLAFERQFLRDRGAIPDSCTVIKARGDSMTPTIPDGSLLVVDHSQCEVANGYITVIGIGDDLLVKRIRRRLDGMVELISDNAAYAPEVIGAERLSQLRIVGRVIYFCRVP